jgi:hypothetical protein
MGVRRLIQGRAAIPWRGNFFPLIRIRDWLKLLDLEPVAAVSWPMLRRCRSRAGWSVLAFWSARATNGGRWLLVFTALKRSSASAACV